MTWHTANAPLDILFAFPNYDGFGGVRGMDHHLGAGYIQAHLRQHGVSTAQFIQSQPRTLPQLADEMLTLRPSVIGFTCYDHNYYYVKLLSCELKRRAPEVTIVAGGVSATFSDRFLLADSPDIDVLVRYEGEQTSLELLDTLDSGRDLASVRGIAYRRNGRLVRTPSRPPFPAPHVAGDELDVLPSPYLEGVIPYSAGADVGVLTSRGCRYLCTYCNFSAMSRHQIRYHSPHRVLAELWSIDAHTPKPAILQIFDDALTSDKEHVMEICRGLSARPLQKLHLSCNTRADLLDREIMLAMYDAGFLLNLGLESAVPEVLKTARKLHTSGQRMAPDTAREQVFLETMRQQVACAKEIGFPYIAVSVILGLPGETPQDARQTLRFVKELGVTEYAHNILSIYPGTQLFRSCRQHGLEVERSAFGLPYITRHAYQVDQIPLLKNAWHRRMLQDQVRDTFSLLEGRRDRQDDTAAQVCISQSAVRRPAVMRRLATELVLPSQVFVWAEHSESGLLTQDARSVVSAGAPIRSWTYLVTKPGAAPTALEIKTPTSHSFPGERTIGYVVPFGEWHTVPSIQAHAASGQDRPITLSRLSTLHDLQNLRALAQTVADDGWFSIPAWTLNAPHMLLDSCRWLPGTCSAPDLLRIIVDENGGMKPCLDGEVVGQAEAPWSRARANLDRTRKQAARTRRCDQCEATHHCPGCLFTGSIPPKWYCRVQRGSSPHRHIILAVVTLMGAFVGMEDLNAAPDSDVKIKLQRGTALFGSPGSLSRSHLGPPTVHCSNVAMLSLHGIPYVLDLARRRLFGIDLATAHVLEAIIDAREPWPLIHELQTKYGARDDVIREVIRGIEEALRAHGWVAQ